MQQNSGRTEVIERPLVAESRRSAAKLLNGWS